MELPADAPAAPYTDAPRRERPESPLLDEDPSPALAFLGCSVGGLLAGLAAVSVIVVLQLPVTAGPGLIVLSLAMQPPMLLGIVLALLAGRIPIRRGIAWHSVPWPTLVLAPIGLLGASILGDWCGTAVWHATGKNQGALQLIAESVRAVPVGWRPLMIIGLGLVPGLCEEAGFRGMLQGSLLRYGRVVSLLVPALAFAVFHGDLVQGTGALVLGLYLGELRHRTGSIVPGVAAHAVNNLVAGVAMSMASDAELARMQSAPPALVAVGGVAALLCLLGARRGRA